MNEQSKSDTRVFTCPKCGGNMLVRGIEGALFTQHLGDMPWTSKRTSLIGALVCDNCGYAEIYAANREKLRD